MEFFEKELVSGMLECRSIEEIVLGLIVLANSLSEKRNDIRDKMLISKVRGVVTKFQEAEKAVRYDNEEFKKLFDTVLTVKAAENNNKGYEDLLGMETELKDRGSFDSGEMDYRSKVSQVKDVMQRNLDKLLDKGCSLSDMLESKQDSICVSSAKMKSGVLKGMFNPKGQERFSKLACHSKKSKNLKSEKRPNMKSKAEEESILYSDDDCNLSEDSEDSAIIASKIDRFKNAGVTNEYIELQYYCHDHTKPIKPTIFWVDLLTCLLDHFRNPNSKSPT